MEEAAAAVVLALRMQVGEGLTVVRGSSLGGSSLGGSSLESTARGGVSNKTERIALGTVQPTCGRCDTQPVAIGCHNSPTTPRCLWAPGDFD